MTGEEKDKINDYLKRKFADFYNIESVNEDIINIEFRKLNSEQKFNDKPRFITNHGYTFAIICGYFDNWFADYNRSNNQKDGKLTQSHLIEKEAFVDEDGVFHYPKIVLENISVKNLLSHIHDNLSILEEEEKSREEYVEESPLKHLMNILDDYFGVEKTDNLSVS